MIVVPSWLRRVLPLAVVAGCAGDAVAPEPPPPPEPPPRVVFTVTATDSLLTPGAPFHIRGHRLATATVTIGSTHAPHTLATDTLLVVQVPRESFEPCVPVASSLSVSVRSGDAVEHHRVRAQATPRRLQLAPNAFALATDAMGAGCEIVLEDPGEYLLVPFRSDGTGPLGVQDERDAPFSVTYGTPSSTIAARVSGPPPSAAWREAAPSPATDVRMALDASARPTAAVRQADPAVCAIPAVVGDSARFTVVREADWRTDTATYWWLAGRSERLAVFYDAFTRDRLRSQAGSAERLRGLLDYFDAVALATLDRYLPPIPDKDGNGRITVFLSARPGAGRALAFPRQGLREGCDTPGEATMLPLTGAADTGFPTEGWLYSALVHEVAHIAHLGGAHRSDHYTLPAWVIEGFATLVSEIATIPHHPAPLEANFAVFYQLRRAGHQCVDWYRWEEARTKPYGVGCFRLAYALQQAMRETGLDLRGVIQRFTMLDGPLTMPTLRNGLAGTARSAGVLMAEWNLARYADDRLPGRPPALDIGFWNYAAVMQELREQWTTAVPIPPVHDHQLTAGVRYVVRLRQPEAHYILLAVDAQDPRPLTVVTEGSPASMGSELVILRLR